MIQGKRRVNAGKDGNQRGGGQACERNPHERRPKPHGASGEPLSKSPCDQREEHGKVGEEEQKIGVVAVDRTVGARLQHHPQADGREDERGEERDPCEPFCPVRC